MEKIEKILLIIAIVAIGMLLIGKFFPSKGIMKPGTQKKGKVLKVEPETTDESSLEDEEPQIN